MVLIRNRSETGACAASPHLIFIHHHVDHLSVGLEVRAQLRGRGPFVETADEDAATLLGLPHAAEVFQALVLLPAQVVLQAGL